MAWYLAPSLDNLRSEINARWPNRDKRSDGTIGDTAHQARKSDHNPNVRDSVNAFDWDKDGVNPKEIIRACIKHPSTNYVIFDRVIWSRRYNFRARRYTGSNPHTGHGHTSALQTREAEQNRQPWEIADMGMLPIRQGTESEDVGYFQVRLKRTGFYEGKIDNIHGPIMASAILACRKSLGSNARTGKKIARHAAEQIDRVYSRWAAQEDSNSGGASVSQVKNIVESARIQLP